MLQDDKQRYLALDSLRGICATLVVFYHFEGVTVIGSVPFVRNAFLFVDFFFVLSGFVIASGYAEHIAAGLPIPKFILLRLGRLYPLHAVMLLAYVVVAAGKHFADPSYNVADFAVSALLFQVWADYVPPEMNHWNPPSWSISAEIWTYLVFAMVISTFQKRIAPLFVALITASLLFLVTSSNRYVAVCFSGGGFFRCTFGFSFGVLAYLAYRRWPMTFLQ
jgi:peptidoglycan/LPS O-acetylase OafA/YrhL